jgi:serine/threonine-protein kinase
VTNQKTEEATKAPEEKDWSTIAATGQATIPFDLTPAQSAGASASAGASRSATDRSASISAIGVPDRVEQGMVLFGRYEVQAKLGGGGMGSVWLVRHVELDAQRALKLIDPRIASDMQMRSRFRREARIMARLEHPHAVKVHHAELGTDGGYLEMEYVKGTALKDVLQPGKPMELSWVARLLDQLAGVLQAAHELSIVHRDLKPSNLMLVGDNPKENPPHLKVLDFGIAKVIGAEAADPEDVKTQAGSFIGTPLYSSPEQILGQEITPAADLYSTGIMLYELLSGHRPFVGPAGAVIGGHLHREAPPFAVVNPETKVPAEVERLVMECLAKDPKKRPAEARVLAERFRAAAGLPALAGTGTLSVAPVGAPAGVKTGRSLRILAGLAAVALILYGIWKYGPWAATSSLGLISEPGTRGRIDSTERARQYTVWEQRGFVPAGVEEGPDGWPVALETTASRYRFARDGSGYYLPEHYRPKDDARASDGWPAVLVRGGDQVEFVRIPGGTFEMGGLVENAGGSTGSDRPAHPVALSGYYIQANEVSNREVGAYLAGSALSWPGWKKAYDRLGSECSISAETAGMHPAVGMNWNEARRFAQAHGGDLPTEAQWEYAARSRGKKIPLVWDVRGASASQGQPISRLGNINTTSLANPCGTVAARSFAEDVTEQGLFDMAGNAREWCRDWFAPYTTSREAVIDPIQESTPEPRKALRVVRGGSHLAAPAHAGTTYRDEPGPVETTAEDLGFRVVIECPTAVPVLQD